MSPSGSNRPNQPIDVLVVDDSAVVRQVMTEVLDGDGGLRVVTASDPLIARTKMKRRRPDVIVLDLEMPRMDGLTFLTSLMETDPIPVVICSGHVGANSDQAMLALERGAVDIVSKPHVGIRDFVYDSALMLRNTVRAAARARVHRRGPLHRPRPQSPQIPRSLTDLSVTVDKVVAVGASTGGTQALANLLTAMPEGAPGLVIVQHMPAGFTRSFAERLDATCCIRVKEAEAGDRIEQGLALIAPGDRHLRLRRQGIHCYAELLDGPLISGHRPSVDALFGSVAEALGKRAIGVLMTGMGADGAEGLLEMRKAGAHTVAQDEKTSVVFGMPKEAIRRGAVMKVLPLQGIAAHVLRRSCAYRAG